MTLSQPGHAYGLRAWYGWIGLMTSGPSGESSMSVAEEGPQDNEQGDHKKGDHDEDIGASLVLPAERIEPHGTGA